VADRSPPFSVRVGRRPPDDLVDGVPSWLSAFVLEWTRVSLSFIVEPALVSTMARVLRFPLGHAHPQLRADAVMAVVENDVHRAQGHLTLDIVNYLLEALQEHPEDFVVPSSIDLTGSLERALEEGGSKWRVATDGGQLEHRVDPTYAAQAAAAIDAGDRGDSAAGRHLAAAWSALYRRSPHPGEAIDEAIKAVEAAAKPVLRPGHWDGSVGTVVLRELSNHPEDWVFPMALVDGRTGEVRARAADIAHGLAATIWFGQGPRHGADTSAEPKTRERAEVIVSAAITLVQWFASGYLHRREDAPGAAAGSPPG
jgi:hypothetical protein